MSAHDNQQKRGQAAGNQPPSSAPRAPRSMRGLVPYGQGPTGFEDMQYQLENNRQQPMFGTGVNFGGLHDTTAHQAGQRPGAPAQWKASGAPSLRRKESHGPLDVTSGASAPNPYSLGAVAENSGDHTPEPKMSAHVEDAGKQEDGANVAAMPATVVRPFAPRVRLGNDTVPFKERREAWKTFMRAESRAMTHTSMPRHASKRTPSRDAQLSWRLGKRLTAETRLLAKDKAFYTEASALLHVRIAPLREAQRQQQRQREQERQQQQQQRNTVVDWFMGSLNGMIEENPDPTAWGPLLSNMMSTAYQSGLPQQQLQQLQTLFASCEMSQNVAHSGGQAPDPAWGTFLGAMAAAYDNAGSQQAANQPQAADRGGGEFRGRGGGRGFGVPRGRGGFSAPPPPPTQKRKREDGDEGQGGPKSNKTQKG
ncbi:hypothetical protein IWX90DRAFT_415255 [Phyllosticta citrichinensis]|uniref:Uncharacterized protein n=1 Tax=Phyllosticta citrichinensis TaxID=1130410 RepID=A0ABR1XUG5_9PEZI